MIIKYDEWGKKYKEAETPEEYLLLEIERLKEENKELKKELELERIKKTLNLYIEGCSESTYLLSLKDGRINLKEYKEDE